MFSYLFHLIAYNPLYNGLVFLIGIIPGADVGLAVIFLTCVVRLILFPLSKSSVRTQMKMKEVEPELAKIKEQYKDNKEELARQTMDVYKRYGLNPFSGIFLMLIQLPILIALYLIFFKAGLPNINKDLLYSFISVPTNVSMHFIGLLDVGQRSILLGVLAGVAQFFQIRLSIPAYKSNKNKDGEKPSMKDDLARSMNMQMRYVMPAMIFFISLGVSGAVALYWITGSLFTIAQEIYFRKTIKKEMVKSLN